MIRTESSSMLGFVHTIYETTSCSWRYAAKSKTMVWLQLLKVGHYHLHHCPMFSSLLRLRHEITFCQNFSWAFKYKLPRSIFQNAELKRQFPFCTEIKIISKVRCFKIISRKAIKRPLVVEHWDVNDHWKSERLFYGLGIF